MSWFDRRKVWGKLPAEYLHDWLENKLVVVQSGEIAEFDDGTKLKLEFVGGGFWGEGSMTPVPTEVQWSFQERTDEETLAEEAMYVRWQQNPAATS